MLAGRRAWPVWWSERGDQNPIPSRTRPLTAPAPRVLCLKTRESRSPPDLPSTYAFPPRENTLGAGWSSPVARQAHNLKVTGSNPVPATKPNEKPRRRKPAGLFVFRLSRPPPRSEGANECPFGPLDQHERRELVAGDGPFEGYLLSLHEGFSTSNRERPMLDPRSLARDVVTLLGHAWSCPLEWCS